MRRLAMVPLAAALLLSGAGASRMVYKKQLEGGAEEAQRFIDLLRVKGEDVGKHPFGWFGEQHDTKVAVKDLACGYDGEAVLFVTRANDEEGPGPVTINVYAENKRDQADPKATFMAKCLAIDLFQGDDFDKGNLQGIGNFAPAEGLGRCPVVGKKVGAALMELAETLFKCFRQRKVGLSDSSALMCEGDGGARSVPLAAFRTLHRGQTWYQSFGFVAVNKDVPHQRRVQQALFELAFSEMKHVYDDCGQKSDKVTAKYLEQYAGLLSDKHPRAGDFFSWLFKENCPAMKQVLNGALVFPCASYSSSSLKELKSFPDFAGAMEKVYEYQSLLDA